MSSTSSDRYHERPTIYRLSANPSGEDLEKYVLNGLHPVEIGEYYDNGKYRIVHKLGNGGSSTVWIAQSQISTDQQLYALKFLSSYASARSHELEKTQRVNTLSSLQSYVSRLVDSFDFRGPNCPIGRTNRVLVFELLGPSISHLSYGCCRLHPRTVQTVMHQVTKALAELHKANIVHRDLTPRNILLKLNPKVYSLSPDLLYQNFGQPDGSMVCRVDERDPKPHAPNKYFWSIDFTKQPNNLLPSPTIIDFGESADSRRTSSSLRTIPPMWASPEAIFENRVDPSCDIWSLGCVIFKARAGYDLFPGDHWAPDQVREVAEEMVSRLGCRPPFKSWATAKFNGRGGVILPHSYELRNRTKTRSWIKKIKCEYYPPLRDEIRKIRDRPAEAESNEIFWTFGPWRGRRIIYAADDHKFPRISPKEADLMYDMMSRIFVWDPRKRITAAELVGHPWFRFHT